jgi:hypothetical protein
MFYYMPNPLLKTLSTTSTSGLEGIFLICTESIICTWRRPTLGKQRALFQNATLVTTKLRQ